jgi:peroxiredoxin
METKGVAMRRFVTALAVGLGLTAIGMVQAQAPTPELKVKVGDMAPEFSLPGTDGKTHTLSQYKGHVVVLAWFPAAFTGG